MNTSFLNLYEKLFYRALRIRRLEEKIIELYPTDKIQSPVHLSIGQEAVAVGVCHPLRDVDLLFGTYRSHAFYLAKGGDMNQMMAELYGKKTGCGAGKAGSMHLAAIEVGFMGSSAVVASSIPHAVGAALAAKQLRKDQVIVAVYGDGATDEGVYHESLNFASLRKLPVLFICENNGLAVHSFASARQSFNILDHAKAYGLYTSKVNEGYDFMKVEAAMRSALQKVKQEQAPYFLEILTFRYKEHVGIGEDFDAGYRQTDAYLAWQQSDPLIQDQGSVSKFDPLIQAEITEAVAYAEQSSFPGAEELLTDTY
jgi:TPP-dependent pyruvate/acetoin dehydrogenase alpha subunit